jgi:hypothetical protein
MRADAAVAPSPVAVPTSTPVFAAASITATIAVPAQAQAQAPVMATTPAPTPALEAEPILETPIDDVAKPDVSAREAVLARSAPQPVAEARNAALALNADPAAEPVQSKQRTRSVASAMAELAALPGTPAHDIRAVTAAPAASTIDPLPRDRAAALVETIATLRSEARGDTLNLAIRHDDFGPLSIRFEQSDDSVVVRFDTKDADLARLIADAGPDLKSAGEPHGVRFERRDTSGNATNNGASNGANNGGGTSGSHDSSRQGREQPRTQTYRQPQSRQDRGGIFA